MRIKYIAEVLRDFDKSRRKEYSFLSVHYRSPVHILVFPLSRISSMARVILCYVNGKQYFMSIPVDTLPSLTLILLTWRIR